MSQTQLELVSTEDDELYAAFFQDRYYAKKRAMMLEGKGISFNGWAFFFGIVWFLHRKMYVEAAVVLIVKIAYNISEENLKAGKTDPNDGFLMSIGEALIFGIVIGYVANPIYLSKARRAVAKAKRLYSGTMQRKLFLQREGGTAGAVPVIVGFILLMLIYLYDFIMN